MEVPWRCREIFHLPTHFHSHIYALPRGVLRMPIPEYYGGAMLTKPIISHSSAS